MEINEQVKEFIKKEAYIEEICEKFEIDELKLYSIISKLKLEGYNIVSQKKVIL